MSQQHFALHHLPTKEQNLLYIFVLIASPLLNLFVNSLVYTDLHMIALRQAHEFSFLNWIFAASSFLLGTLLTLLGINLAHTLMARHQKHVRKSLSLFGIFSTIYLLINLITIFYGIFEFKVQSFFLLFVSICIYISMNITFLFWYWFLDYPSQVRRLHHPEATPEISFPQSTRQSSDWVPNILDYIYFTVLTSNTLGPPENHSPEGQKAKAMLLLHSNVMLVILVIFVSRAINTLA